LSVSTVLEKIIICPSAPENTNARRKNVKRSLPNFLNKESSMKILLDAKLTKSRELVEKKKKLREREEKKEAKKGSKNQKAGDVRKKTKEKPKGPRKEKECRSEK